MNITYDSFLELQPPVTGAKSNQRLWNFLLVSVLLHLILIELLINHYSPYAGSSPLTVIPSLSISITNPETDTPAETYSPPAVSVDETNRPKRHERIKKQATHRTGPLAVPPSPSVVLPVRPGRESVPKAADLIEKGLDYAARTGKEMEARISPGMFITKANKNKLLMAMTMQAQQDPAIDSPAPLQVYNNQYGDLVYQTGNSCMAVPAVLVPFMFKQINSIIATPIACGNGSKESTFSLK